MSYEFENESLYDTSGGYFDFQIIHEYERVIEEQKDMITAMHRKIELLEGHVQLVVNLGFVLRKETNPQSAYMKAYHGLKRLFDSELMFQLPADSAILAGVKREREEREEHESNSLLTPNDVKSGDNTRIQKRMRMK